MLNVATLKVVLVKCDLLRLVFGGLDWPYQFFFLILAVLIDTLGVLLH